MKTKTRTFERAASVALVTLATGTCVGALLLRAAHAADARTVANAAPDGWRCCAAGEPSPRPDPPTVAAPPPLRVEP